MSKSRTKSPSKTFPRSISFLPEREATILEFDRTLNDHDPNLSVVGVLVRYFEAELAARIDGRTMFGKALHPPLHIDALNKFLRKKTGEGLTADDLVAMKDGRRVLHFLLLENQYSRRPDVLIDVLRSAVKSLKKEWFTFDQLAEPVWVIFPHRKKPMTVNAIDLAAKNVVEGNGAASAYFSPDLWGKNQWGEVLKIKAHICGRAYNPRPNRHAANVFEEAAKLPKTKGGLESLFNLVEVAREKIEGDEAWSRFIKNVRNLIDSDPRAKSSPRRRAGQFDRAVA